MIVDRGADFGSVSFETLFTRYGITKKERPAQQPRFGSVIERLFGTTTTMFLNQLLGNTQATKVPRQMTREVDPKRLAVWTLEHFSTRCAEWMYLSQWHWFAEWSIGCIGILRDWVVDSSEKLAYSSDSALCAYC